MEGSISGCFVAIPFLSSSPAQNTVASVIIAGAVFPIESSEVIRSTAFASGIGRKLTAAVTQRMAEAETSMNLIIGKRKQFFRPTLLVSRLIHIP